MSPQRIRWLAVAAAVLVLLAAVLAWRKTVIILADGTAYTVTTRALTVGSAVRAAELELGPDDTLTPGGWTWLQNGLIIDLQRASQVVLRADGEEYSLVTTQRDPEALLTGFGVELGPEDRLLLVGERWALDAGLPYSPSLLLEVRRAVTITLEVDGDEVQFSSSAATLGEALAEEGYTLLDADRLQPAADAPLDGPIEAKLTPSQPIEISIGSEVFQLRSAAATVGQALAAAGIALQGLDRAEPAEDQPVPEDGDILIRRIYETVELSQAIITYDVEWVADPETEFGATSVIELGQNGVMAARVRVRYEDGEEISRDEEGEWVLVEPQTQISGYGSQIVVRTTVVDGVEIEYWASMEMYATSYSPCRSGVDKCLYGTSTSGVVVQKGVIATYLDWYRAAVGISLYVPGYGQGTIYDNNGAYYDGRPWIDLGYSDEEWVPWSGWVTVYFTTPVPASIPFFLYP